MSYHTYRTQKAQGINALENAGLPVPSFSVHPVERLQQMPYPLDCPMFARPCPTKPRHGFVDSRIVRNGDDLRALANETFAQDSQGEIVLMPPIDAECSGILTPGRLTLGDSNDGATSGRNCLVLPYVYKAEDTLLSKSLLKAANIHTQPYLELVWNKLKYYTVQLRDGVKLPLTVDYVPKAMRVKQVLHAEGSLLEWESKIAGLTDTDGLVVEHVGGDLASHYAVHCISHGIPIVTSKASKVGQMLQPSDLCLTPDIRELRRGARAAFGHAGEGMERTETRLRKYTLLMLTGARNASVWAGTADFALGAAMGAALRVCLAACNAEIRYLQDENGDNEGGKSRTSCWKNSLKHRSKPWKKLLDGFFEGKWSGSFGGPMWGSVALYGAEIDAALAKGDASEAIAALNRLVDAYHNNGWAFNKFASDDWLYYTPEHLLIDSAPLVYEIWTQGRQSKRNTWAGPSASFLAPYQKMLAEFQANKKKKIGGATLQKELEYASSMDAVLKILRDNAAKLESAQIRALEHGTRLQVQLVEGGYFEVDRGFKLPTSGEATLPSMVNGSNMKYYPIDLGGKQ